MTESDEFTPATMRELLAEAIAERDAARFEASRARGEAHAANLALKELRKKRNAECRALGRVLMIVRDVLEPAELTGSLAPKDETS